MFSTVLHLREVPEVVVSVEKDAAWLDLDHYSEKGETLTSMTVHLASEPWQLRQLARHLNDAADTIEAAHPRQEAA